MTTVNDELMDRINGHAGRCKVAWYTLLTYLSFVLISALGVEDADFFINERQTQLPLVGLSVPTLDFFKGAPMLGFALFAYFHFNLFRVWEAVAVARQSGQLDDPSKLPHWMVIDVATTGIDRSSPSQRPFKRVVPIGS